MITDQNLIFTTSAAITTPAAIGDVVDLAAVRDVGEGKTLYAYVYVKTAFGGGGTVTFQVKSSSDDSTIEATDATIGASETFGTSDLTVGKVVAIKLNPQLGSTGAQYIGLWAATTSTVNAGAVGACLVLDIQDGKKSYATNIVTGD